MALIPLKGINTAVAVFFLLLSPRVSASVPDSFRIMQIHTLGNNHLPLKLKGKIIHVSDSGISFRRRSFLPWIFRPAISISPANIKSIRTAHDYGRSAIGCGIGTVAGALGASLFVHTYLTRSIAFDRSPYRTFVAVLGGSAIIGGGSLLGSVIGEESRPRIWIYGKDSLYRLRLNDIRHFALKPRFLN